MSSLIFSAISTPQNVFALFSLPSGVDASDVNLVMNSIGGYNGSSFPYYSPPNGCGSEGNTELVPDRFLGIIDFTPACQKHDQCYMIGSDRITCDKNFLIDMLEICARSPAAVLPCEAISTFYYTAVSASSIISILELRFREDQEKQKKYEADVSYYLPQIIEASKPISYRVIVRTGDIKHAETDARVYIKLNGEFASTGYIRLDNPNKNDFERASISTFVIDKPNNVGRIHSVTIKHSSNGDGPGWFLSSVDVNDLTFGRDYGFGFENWLRDEYQKGQSTCATLEASGRSMYHSVRVPGPGTIHIDPNEPQFAGICP